MQIQSLSDVYGYSRRIESHCNEQMKHQKTLKLNFCTLLPKAHLYQHSLLFRAPTIDTSTKFSIHIITTHTQTYIHTSTKQLHTVCNFPLPLTTVTFPCVLLYTFHRICLLYEKYSIQNQSVLRKHKIHTSILQISDIRRTHTQKTASILKISYFSLLLFSYFHILCEFGRNFHSNETSMVHTNI